MKRIFSLLLVAAIAVTATGCCCRINRGKSAEGPVLEVPDVQVTYAPETYMPEIYAPETYATEAVSESWFAEGYTLYNNTGEQKNAWITFHADCSFEMSVNLYEGYGLCTGYYEVTAERGNAVIYCTIEDRNYLGFSGDQIVNFYLTQQPDGSYLIELLGGDCMGTLFDYTYFAE